MRQVREVLRLTHVCGHSGHQVAAMVGISRYTVAEYLRRAGVLGITWPVPDGLDDAALELAWCMDRAAVLKNRVT